MKNLKYLFQFCLAILSFTLFKFLGANLSSNLCGKIFEKIGPYFRSKKIINSNIKKAFPNINSSDLKKITQSMWNNYGRVFAEYMFIKSFRFGNLATKIEVQGQDILDEIVNKKKQVVFVSGHLANFELMAMYLEKTGVKLCTIYRPLNNIFLNKIMENVRIKYICKNQIKKGIGGLKKLIMLKKNKYSTALMIDQRVSEGILSNFFNEKALTTTIPAQLVKKFDIPVVPVYIERIEHINFKIKIGQTINFSKHDSTEYITDKLNQILEKMIIHKPDHWIWSHNRWK